MKKGNKVVLGLFDSTSTVEAAVERFKAAGFRNSDISVLMPRTGDPASLAHEKATKAPEGTAIGSGTGAVLGGALGWLVGAGSLAAIPALGPLVAAGPILAALTGMGVGGAVGGLTGALVGYGVPEYEAKRYETLVKEGNTLVSVHVDDREWQAKAKNIFEECGAHDIATSTEEADKRTPKSNETSTMYF